MGYTIGLKIGTVSAAAKTIAIIRKYSNDSMGSIKKSIQNKGYVLLFQYTNRFGLKKVIECYDELKNNGIKAEVYELDDEITSIEFLRNLDKTYDEISEEIDADS